MSISSSIDTYIKELKSYNAHTNIYSSQAYERLDFHIQDCLTLADLIGNDPVRVLDIGSGSGFPAVIIAIKNPKNRVRAVESKSRKTTFLEQVKTTLRLPNLEIIQANIVEYARTKPAKAEIVTAKAFGSLEKVVHVSKSLRKPKSVIWIPISQAQASDLDMEHARVVRHDAFYYARWGLD